MNWFFFMQVTASFLAGGIMISILSLLAERAGKNLAGIVMTFPSTLILGFFFLGLTSSPQKVASVVPATLIPLGIVIFSSVIYIYCSIFFSRHFSSKISQIVVTCIASSIIWFFLAAPFAIWKFKDLFLGITGFLILISITQLVLKRVKHTKEINRPKYTKLQLMVRALCSGSVIALIVVLTKLLNPFWGGVFTMFPAATFATLMIFHFYYQPRQLFYFFKNAPVGSLSLFTYAISVMILFPKFGIIIGTAVSCCFSLTLSVLLMRCMSYLAKNS